MEERSWRDDEKEGERQREVEERSAGDEGEGGARGTTDSANNALVAQKKKKGRSIIASPRGRYFSNRTPSVNWRAN